MYGQMPTQDKQTPFLRAGKQYYKVLVSPVKGICRPRVIEGDASMNPISPSRSLWLAVFSATLLLANDLGAQNYPQELFENVEWESVGPARGGRSTAAAGSDTRPLEYYFGASGGGLWKTTDAGINWFNYDLY